MSSTEVTEVASGFCSDDLNVWILSRLTTCLNLVHQGDRDQRQHWGQHRKRSVFLLDAFLSFGLVCSEIGGFDLNAVEAQYLLETFWIFRITSWKSVHKIKC